MRGASVRTTKRPQVTAGYNANEEGIAIRQVDAPIGYFIRRAQVSVFQRFRSHFADLQLRPVEFSILTLIQHNPGRKQTEIAQALDIKRANFVPIIDGLEGRGLLERRRSLDDRRANALYLTLEGEKFVTSLRKRHEALERFFTSRLGGESEREQLLTLLLRLL